METLLLPGMDGTGRLFAPLIPHLSSALGARIVAFPPDEPQTYEQLLDAIPIPAGTFCIIAESFSGPIGIGLAARHPDRVRGLVLVATFVESPSTLARWVPTWLSRLLFELRMPNFALRTALLGKTPGLDQLLELRAALRAVKPTVLAARLAAVAAVDAKDQLACSTAPLMYLGGRRDRLVGQKALSQVKRLRPDVTTHVLDAPHLVLQCRPVEAGRLICEFLLPLAPP
ncbi:MAG: alpha/beta hydrolase [Deltaproteobacteria bacterium]|nr:alpha/beta hydrolase [Deltaproteobacteria bacterium]